MLPFLVLIALGFIVVMGFQLFQNFFGQSKPDAFFYVYEGKARILPFGQSEWDEAYSGTKLLIGDKIKTLGNGRLIMDFFNGSKVRADHDSAVSLTDLSKAVDSENILLSVDNGKVWVNAHKSTNVKESKVQVRIANALVKSKGTIFEVESNDTQVIRVFEGQVDVDVLVDVDGKQRVAETITIGVGQEITLDEAVIKSFAQGNNPSILKGVNDDFKGSSWYKWNMAEDISPSVFEKGKLQNSSSSLTEEIGDDTSETEETQQTQVLSDEDSTPDAEPVLLEDLEKPELSNPADGTDTVKAGQIYKMSGTVSSATQKVFVEQNLAGVKSTYTLGKYQAGSKQWSYNISATYGNLADGENVYKVYAIDKNGKKSDPVTVKLNYSAPVEKPAPVETTSEVNEKPKVTETSESKPA